MEKLWLMREVNPEWQQALVQAGHSPLVARLLASRGCSSEEDAHRYLAPSLAEMHNPFLLKDMDRAVRLLLQAVKERWRIRLITDYDADGVTSGSMFWRFLRRVYRKLGLPEELVDCITPDRFTEGYGLNPQRVRDAARDGVQLIITFDCGIRSREEADLARDLGIRMIITDHHGVPEGPLPAADAVINPHRPDCPYPFKHICGVHVAFKLMWAFMLAAKGSVGAILGDLDFVATGTVADMMPLTGENRAVVRAGLALLNGEGLTVNGKVIVPPGVRRLSLVALAGALDDAECVIDVDTIGFQIGPRINSCGRVASAQDCIDYFQLDDPEEIRARAVEIDANNDLRQRLTDHGVKMVRESIDPDNPPPAIVFSSDFAELGERAYLMKGVVGIVAGRIGQEFHRPTVVLQETGDGLAVGSARAILDAVHLLDTLTQVEHLFTRFGGHKPAAGLTLPVENIPALREHLCRTVEALPSEERVPRIYLDGEVSAADLERETEQNGFPLITTLAQMEPFGLGNPKPLFLLRGARVIEARGVGKTEPKQHLKLKVRVPGSRLIVDAIAWNQYPVYLAEGQPEVVDLAFVPRINAFRGECRLQLMVEAWRPAEAVSAAGITA